MTPGPWRRKGRFIHFRAGGHLPHQLWSDEVQPVSSVLVATRAHHRHWCSGHSGLARGREQLQTGSQLNSSSLWANHPLSV